MKHARTFGWVAGVLGAVLTSLAGSAVPAFADEPAAAAPAPVDVPPPPRTGGCGLPCDPALGCGYPRACGDLYVGAGLSLLPNVGGYLQVGRVFRADACSVWSLEAEATWQPIDDKTFVDDGNPVAGDWLQLQVGVKRRSDPGSRRHWVTRAGAFVFDASTDPNWVNTEGLWAGGYVGLGFETDVRPDLSIGPTLTLMAGAAIDEGGDFNVVPQLTWGITWWPGAGCRAVTCPCLPRGEIYLDLGITALPGMGQGSVGFGQVISRGPRAVWSFEVGATFQDLEDGTLQGESAGDYAQLSGGVKVAFSPARRSHLVLRGGATWLRTTGEVEPLSGAGDYVGLYAGVGYEWDIGAWLTTGPEVQVAAVAQEGTSEFDVLPRLGWHVILKF